MSKIKFSNQRGPRFYHNMTQAVRAHLGLTQDHLATLMQVSRAAVSMDEHGTRALPWPQVQLLQALHAALPAANAPASPALLHLTAADRDELDFRRKGLAIQVHALEQKLERVQVGLAQARCWQQVLPQLRRTFPAENASAQEWLTHFERRAASILHQESGTAALLQLQQMVLAFEIAEITRLLGEEPPTPTGA